MTSANSNDQIVGMLRDTIVALVRKGDYNLSARQLGVFLTCYLEDGEHTVRGLAADLHVSKPAITRALDRLGEFDLARRQADPRDRRSVLVRRTGAGQAYLRNLRGAMLRTKGVAKTPDVPGEVAMGHGPRGATVAGSSLIGLGTVAGWASQAW